MPRYLPLFALAVAALTAACRPTSDGAAPDHLILITVDTLRADHLSAYGYPRDTSPRLAEIARQGVVFERAVAQWPKTGPSFASIFTGQFPQTTGLTHKAALSIPEAYFTLPVAMKKLDFETVGVVSNGVLGARLGWNRGFDSYAETWTLAPESSSDPREYRRWLNARVVNQLALPLLTEHRDASRLFAWIHYSDPHAPYYLPEGVENPFVGDPWYVGDEPVQLFNPEATALDDRRDLKHYVAQYDANIRFTDDHMALLLDHLDELGILQDSLVVFTADHGESLGEHGYYFGHGRLPYNPGAHVPLIFWRPDGSLPPRRVEHPVQMVDLLPTLWEWFAPAEEPIPGIEGRSLVGDLRGDAPEPAPPAFAQAGGGSPTTHFRSVQEDRYKLIFHPPMGQGAKRREARWELYDLENDPGETRNLLEEETAEFRRLRRLLKEWMKGENWIRRSRQEVEAYSQETLDALKALGYIND